MLSRDYELNPIKRYEVIPEEDLIELYMVKNLSKTECAKELGCTNSKIDTYVIKYKLQKTNEQLQAMKRRRCMEKYGVDSPNKLKEVRDKAKNTCLEKYGVDNCFKDKEKVKQGVQNKYGVDNVATLQEIKNKKKETCLKKYGVDHISKLDYY